MGMYMWKCIKSKFSSKGILMGLFKKKKRIGVPPELFAIPDGYAWLYTYSVKIEYEDVYPDTPYMWCVDDGYHGRGRAKTPEAAKADALHSAWFYDMRAKEKNKFGKNGTEEYLISNE